MTDTDQLADRWFRATRQFESVFRARQSLPSPTQLDILNLLAQDGTVSLMDAAARLGVSGATLARAVEAAHSRGWLYKDRDPQDRRVVWLRATPSGEAARTEMLTLARRRLASMLADVDPSDVAVLDRVLARILA